MAMAKTVCPVSAAEFQASAKEFVFKGPDGLTLTLRPMVSSAGSLGWYLGDKVDIKVGGKTAKAQAGLGLWLIGSKPAKTETAA